MLDLEEILKEFVGKNERIEIDYTIPIRHLHVTRESSSGTSGYLKELDTEKKLMHFTSTYTEEEFYKHPGFDASDYFISYAAINEIRILPNK